MFDSLHESGVRREQEKKNDMDRTPLTHIYCNASSPSLSR